MSIRNFHGKKNYHVVMGIQKPIIIVENLHKSFFQCGDTSEQEPIKTETTH